MHHEHASKAHSIGLLALMAQAGIVLAVLAFGAGSASAALQYPLVGQLTGPEQPPNSVAVNDQSAQTLESVSNGSGVRIVGVLDSRGVQVAKWTGANTPAGSFGGDFVLVAAEDSSGRSYVADRFHNVVDVFDSAGNYVCQITGAGSATTSPSECDASDPGTPGGHFGQLEAMAIDQATGDVYVADEGREVIDVFDSAGKYVSQLTGASTPAKSFSRVTGLAVDDSTGDVLAADAGSHVVYVFDAATDGYVTSWTGSAATNFPGTPAGSFGAGEFMQIDADNATGDVYVGDRTDAVVDQLDGSGAYVGQITGVPGGASFTKLTAIGVDQASGNVYAGDESSPGVVDIFGGSQAVVPDVVTGAASAVEATTATLGGSVDPDSIQLSDCRFEYGTTTSYGQSAPCVPAAGSVPPDSSAHTVSANIGGLQPDTTYHFRLQAANANGANFAADETFTSTGPVIESVGVTNLARAAVDLSAQIDPAGEDTGYHFEYGTADCSSGPCASVPAPDADIGSGSTGVAVTQRITGLSANTEYHWRVVATNKVNGGVVTSPEHTFIYDTTGQGLPDGRGYEQVTPAQKNAALVENTIGGLPMDIAADGSRVIYVADQCFGAVGSCPVRAGSLNNQFEATRTADGWVSTPMTPPSALTGGDLGIFSAEAGTALDSIPTPPDGEDDFYERQPGGSFLDIGPSTLPADGPRGVDGKFPYAIAATADLSHVVWENSVHWPFDTEPGGINGTDLLEYTGSGNSQPSLVAVSGLGPNATDRISPECGSSFEGPGGGAAPGEMSADGRTVFFVAHGASGGGCAIGPPANALVDEVGARIDGTLADAHTVILSQRSPAGCTVPACLGSLAENAKFWGASSDGSKAFLTSTQQLTDSATQGSGNLYLYDFDNPSGHELIDASATADPLGPQVQGIVGFSSDGSHVYFIAEGVLDGGVNAQGQSAQDGARNLYVYERDSTYPSGHTAFIAALSAADTFRLGGGDVPWPYANVTPDGRYLVFTSDQTLTSDGANVSGAVQVFRYDAQTGQLLRVTVGNDGFNDNGNAGAGDATIVAAGDFVNRAGPARLDPTMSDDGSRVFFDSPIGLAPHALDDVVTDSSGDLAKNVYEWEQAGVGSCPVGQSAGCVYLISDGHDTTAGTSFCTRSKITGGPGSSVCLLGTDTTGDNVFFTTADQLAPSDTDSGLDIYDARVCEPERGNPCITAASAPPPCLGEQCHGIPSAIPGAPSTPTSTFNGAGNLVPSPPAVEPRSMSAAEVRVKQLDGALRACRKIRSRKRRSACEAAARRRFGASKQAKKSDRRTSR